MSIVNILNSVATNGLSVKSDPIGVEGANSVTNIISVTQAEYDAISDKEDQTLYVVTG